MDTPQACLAQGLPFPGLPSQALGGWGCSPPQSKLHACQDPAHPARQTSKRCISEGTCPGACQATACQEGQKSALPTFPAAPGREAPPKPCASVPTRFKASSNAGLAPSAAEELEAQPQGFPCPLGGGGSSSTALLPSENCRHSYCHALPTPTSSEDAKWLPHTGHARRSGTPGPFSSSKGALQGC